MSGRIPSKAVPERVAGILQKQRNSATGLHVFGSRKGKYVLESSTFPGSIVMLKNIHTNPKGLRVSKFEPLPPLEFTV